jgi:threonine synthase
LFSCILGVQLDKKTVERIGESFLSVSVSDEETLKTMKEFKDEFDVVLCPHSG